jgi:hypothetical protein
MTSITLNSATQQAINLALTGPGTNNENYIAAYNAIAAASGSGAAVLIGFDAATLTGGTGNNLLIDLGNDGTVTAGGGPTQLIIDGDLDTANATGDAITLGNGSKATIDGSSDTISADGTGDVVTLDGNGDAIIASNATTRYAWRRHGGCAVVLDREVRLCSRSLPYAALSIV